MTHSKHLLSTLSVMLCGSVLCGCGTLTGRTTAAGGAGGAAGGAVAGAAAGAPVAGVGAIVGGAAGAVGGYLVGVTAEKNDAKYRAEAESVSKAAERNPAVREAVRDAGTADLNDDGFVTVDEIVAMSKAGLSSDEMIRRLKATQQIFGLSNQQEALLNDKGVAPDVIEALRTMNSELAGPK